MWTPYEVLAVLAGCVSVPVAGALTLSWRYKTVERRVLTKAMLCGCVMERNVRRVGDGELWGEFWQCTVTRPDGNEVKIAANSQRAAAVAYLKELGVERF